MELIIYEMIAYYAPQLMLTILYLVATILAIWAAKYVKPLLQNKVVQVFAENAVDFVEQTFKELHGEEKLNKALEALSLKLARWNIKITAAEMKIMLEAAVKKLNDEYAKRAAAEKLAE